ncbi:carbohydrate ABC transporter permease [Fimbriimonas ginsengisoli]|uniref:Sugar ABC transporter permease n=1 Tax=Fimbriimonas ginsengisoli Gsoil 348 TaxID=661478 RepID=A0A068NW83_FIMGI|nr:sugar ABC transporter permease [Fimbriimonas ginsengisoli]AIE87793.1 sugar ABC transporter permease [Fimbriimonas ginsengisoli Gsoil 348]
MRSKLALRQNLLGYAFIAPWLIGFLVFTAAPFISSIYLSFTRYDIVTSPHWVGAANYASLLHDDPLFWKALGITIKYAFVAVPLGIVAGVGLALLLNADVRGISVYRTIFYLPSIVPAVAGSVVFIWLLNPQVGLVNSILKLFGVTGPNWLNDSKTAFWSLVMMGLWGVGGSMVIYLAGLKDIPVHLYEAAVIDGASGAQRMRRITLPMLTPVIFFNLVMGIIGAFQYFTQAYVMTQGGPEESTTFYALYLFQRAWKYLDMGYASAMAWVLFVLVVTLTALVFRTQRKWVHYGG